MTYLPQLRASLVQAAERQQHQSLAGVGALEDATLQRSGWRRASVGRVWGLSRPLRFALNVALAVAATTTGLTVAGVFQRGAPVGPEVPPTPTTDSGVAIPGSVRLLSLRVADPGGGPPWGLRTFRTTRGLTCVQLGRVEFGTIGLLGQDGTFANDHRFHPLSPDAGANCAATDASGHGFVNVAMQSVPASANTGYAGPAIGSCVSTLQRYPVGFGRRFRVLAPPRATRRACPDGDLRDIYYGLLGPRAASISHPAAGARTVTTATSGADGGYLLIAPPTTFRCALQAGRQTACGNGYTSNVDLKAGAITQVRYRDGHVCRLPAPQPQGTPEGSCPPYGWVSPRAQRIDAGRLAAAIAVQTIPARTYCARAETIIPCDGATPRGYKRLTRAARAARALQLRITGRDPR